MRDQLRKPLPRSDLTTLFPSMNTIASSNSGGASAAARFVGLLETLGVTHVITVPDNTSAPIIDLLQARRHSGSEGRGNADISISLITATREGEAMGIASGLWLGGAKPAVLIQNTGLLEAGDGLRGTAVRMGIPLLLLITCRGFEKARKAGVDPLLGVQDRDVLVRSDLDSVAFMTKATLDAQGIPHWLVTDASDLSPVEEAEAHARAEMRPVAVLIDTTFD